MNMRTFFNFDSLFVLLLLLFMHQVYASKQDQNKQRAAAVGVGTTDNGCKGVLPPPCQCSHVSVECINAQFTTTEYFLQFYVNFEYVESMTFHGNNFAKLEDSLFGHSKMARLKVLNLSANYIIELDDNTFAGLPNLEVLDLSYNEILFNESSSTLFARLPKLHRLQLRKAFSIQGNRNDTLRQMRILEKMFKVADMQSLESVDLSWNFIPELPYNFVCSLPSVTTLILANNLLDTFNINASCLSRLQVLDLTANSFHRLDMNFRTTVAMLPNYSLKLYMNGFHCDCQSHAYITWFRQSTKIKDKDVIICRRASPVNYEGQTLMTVPLDKLDCSVVLEVNSSPRTSSINGAYGWLCTLCLFYALRILSLS